jgi:hypothetical protein
VLYIETTPLFEANPDNIVMTTAWLNAGYLTEKVIQE